MRPIEPIVLGIATILIHEVVHYITHIIMKTEFKGFVVSFKSIGFRLNNDFMRDNNKVILVYLLPLSLSSILLIDFYSPRIFVFGMVNLLWSLIDINNLVSILTKSPDERVEWADERDRKTKEKAFIYLS